MKEDEKYVIMKLKMSETTRLLLIKLAGGERKVGVYLAEIAPILAAAQEMADNAEGQARQIAIDILQSKGAKQR